MYSDMKLKTRLLYVDNDILIEVISDLYKTVKELVYRVDDLEKKIKELELTFGK